MARSAGRTGDHGDLQHQRLDGLPRLHLQDESPTKAQQETTHNELVQHLEELPAPDDNATVGTRRCQLRNTIRSTAFDVLGRASRQHQEWFDDNDANIRYLPSEMHKLHQAYVTYRTDANKETFSRYRRIVQHQLGEMQDV
ncbi:hypothetical protein SprV_0200885000 [Sparganum proliferum]